MAQVQFRIIRDVDLENIGVTKKQIAGKTKDDDVDALHWEISNIGSQAAVHLACRMATGLNPIAFNKDEIAKLIAMRVKAGKLPREDVETGIIKHLFKNGLI